MSHKAQTSGASYAASWFACVAQQLQLEDRAAAKQLLMSAVDI